MRLIAGGRDAAGLGHLEITIHNQTSEIPRAHQALDEMAARHNLPARSVARLHLAIEEHLTNIISHGYESAQTGTISVRLSMESSVLRLEIEDDARPFDLTQAPEVDTSLPMEEKPLGGLGVHLIRKSVDELAYRRADGRNVLTMRKRLN
jgi:serine/threonine-protein kinase RsbW